MKLIPFSNALCKQLLENGYSHFVSRAEFNPAAFSEHHDILTLEAERHSTGNKSVPIEEIMAQSTSDKTQYYVMIRS